ncbi:hypothetical protein PUNSTDRAFT_97244 [Punctularia strigosozonata HHB-11173 SS5]|uniref:uncharacterized protein n=1 Tax=Punctularia strigosozonata (strain HHB-11173) TaxID=741275 RepID=UPI0004416680|nr:uncharacterized protein PUNSTDRAFT_97244 [Punctularia strigosozonata HHB-11173 SS5]EIN12488.1 hypothetical protein PUNSTDRAFT_97244 [Punctularia strigosozonata HHB-11173 SS5]
MKFSNNFMILAAVLVASVASIPIKRDVDPALVPDFGHAANVNPTGTGDCDGAVNGANGQPIKVPCSCPPDRQTFINDLNANVAAGHAVNNPSIAVSFPSDNSQASQLARINAALVTLQNLNGPGVGCPASSTTFVAQQQAIQSGATNQAAAAPAPAAPAPAPAAPADPIAALAPSLGFSSGVNPTGTGDCDGAVIGANGQPVKIPCSCPPAQDVYINALKANVAAGHAVNNPSIAVSFPTDGSNASQAARIQAALVTLQNLNGPGVGCPAASTTLSAQLKAVQ